jgi:superkiller protein 3
MADRYTYFPQIGLTVAAVWTGANCWRSKAELPRWLPALAGAIICACALLTRRQAACWQKSETLFRHAVKVSDKNYVALGNIGVAMSDAGRVDDAISFYLRSLAIRPDYPESLNNLGAAYATKGESENAIKYYRAALRHGANDSAATHYSLGLLLALKSRWSEAIEEFTATLRLAPSLAEAHYNLGYALKVQGQGEKAVIHLAEAVRLKPNFPMAHYNLGCMLADQGQRERATFHLRLALQQQPDYEAARDKLQALESHWPSK